jgi:aldehyde dehydrogenase (NAD+)
MKIIKNIINGVSVSSPTPKYFNKVSPSSSEILYKVEIADEGLVELSIKSAKEAQIQWGKTTYALRAEILFNIASCLMVHKNDLAELLIYETGRNSEAAHSEILAAAKQFRYQASFATNRIGTILNSTQQFRTVIVDHIPMGVVASIIPANTPAANIAWKVAPALIHGNSIVLKSPDEVPLLVNEVMKIFTDSGVPSGVINCIHGPGSITGNALVESKLIDLISFTGSTSTGRLIAEVAARNLTKISLELGGKNPFIAMSDCDVDTAVEMALESAYSNAGQRCSAASLLFVHSDIYEEFKKKFKESSQRYLNHDGLRDIVGPLLKRAQMVEIQKIIDKALDSKIVQLIFGGSPAGETINSKGNYYLPTALEVIQVEVNAPILNAELFGPVVTLEKFMDVDKLVDRLNHLQYGLTCAVHTQDIKNINYFKNNLRYGVINFNGKTFGSEAHFPFGGFRSSGNGTREPGFNSLDIYTQQRNISF